MAGVLLLLLGWATWSNLSMATQVFWLHRADYVYTDATLTDNVCRKYNNHATFEIRHNGEQVTGRDGCLLFAGKGDVVNIYYNKKDLYDNGITGKLARLAIFQAIFLILGGAIYTTRLRKYLLSR